MSPAIAAVAILQACAPRTPSIDHADLSGGWEITFVVTKRGDMRDSVRRPSRDSVVGRMRLERFNAPPRDPKYKEQIVWPGWRGEVLAPFASLLQMPPYTHPGGKYRTVDSLRIGVWDDSTGIKFGMEAVGCSDCGNVFGKGTWQSGTAAGTWGQEFFGIGDSGRWRMRRVESVNKGED
jgi:hypothetical protein